MQRGRDIGLAGDFSFEIAEGGVFGDFDNNGLVVVLHLNLVEGGHFFLMNYFAELLSECCFGVSSRVGAGFGACSSLLEIENRGRVG